MTSELDMWLSQSPRLPLHVSPCLRAPPPSCPVLPCPALPVGHCFSLILSASPCPALPSCPTLSSLSCRTPPLLGLLVTAGRSWEEGHHHCLRGWRHPQVIHQFPFWKGEQVTHCGVQGESPGIYLPTPGAWSPSLLCIPAAL